MDFIREHHWIISIILYAFCVIFFSLLGRFMSNSDESIAKMIQNKIDERKKGE